MKKILSIVLILVLMLFMFGCKSKPIADDEEAYVEKIETEQSADENEEQTEQEQSDEQLPEQNVEQEKNEITEQPEQLESKKAWCDVTIDEPFSEYEVVVALTAEESQKGIEYTAEDFKEYDVFNVYPFGDFPIPYYPEKYFPEYKDLSVIVLMLNEPSKENVLECIKKLEKDVRVYSAEPNFNMLYTGSANDGDVYLVQAVLTEEEANTQRQFAYSEHDFSMCYSCYELNIKDGSEFDYYVYDFKKILGMNIKGYDNLKAAVADPRIERIYPTHNPFCSNSDFTIYASVEPGVYTASDFDYLEIESVEAVIPGEYVAENQIKLTLKEPSMRNFAKAIELLKQDERVKNASSEFEGMIIEG